MFKNLLPGQDDEDKDETTFIFKIYGNTIIIDWEQVIIGNPGRNHVLINEDGIKMKSGDVVRGWWKTDGDFIVGWDLAAAATTFMALFANSQTYNGQSVAAGDMLIGDSSTGKGNIWFDASAGQWEIRSGINALFRVDAIQDFVSLADTVTIDDVELNVGAPIALQEIANTPTAPTGAQIECMIYMKGDKLIVQSNDGGTIRYKYLDLTGTGATWTHTTTAP